MLLPEHIDTIIKTYQARENVDKFAHVASLKTFNNDYNLNIPRYVDTFEAEPEVNLTAVAKALQDLEKRAKKRTLPSTDFVKSWALTRHLR